uniref:Ig-like domain-containing protein n=1 Tax=Poecilia latipinna TaxID=48699 RepID=A0A3B3UNT9_9TELE
TPPSIIKKTGESVDKEIRCSHSIPNHDVILWYKQDENRTLQLLGYLNLNFVTVERDVKKTISFEGDGRTHSDLTVSDLTADDSAVYFCAARYAQFHLCSANSKQCFSRGTNQFVHICSFKYQ